MSAPALKVRYHLTDVDRLNRIADAARAVVIRPDKFRLAWLEAEIREAEEEAK